MKKLQRKLNLSSVIAISIAGMLGGIFVLPGIAAAKTGFSIWIAFLLAGICIFPAVLSKSELATAIPESGGAYLYTERTFGPLIGTISGLGLWISLLLKSAFCLVGFGAYLSVLSTSISINIELLSLISLFIIMLLNILGVKKVGKVQLFIVTLSIITITILLFIGIPLNMSKKIEPFLMYGNEGLFATTAFVYIAYAGVTKVAAIAGEVKNPSRNLPLSMIFSLILITILYTFISHVLVKNIPLEILKNDYTPIYTLANEISGEILAKFTAVIGIFTLISMANSGVLALSRFPFAMANDKLLPKLLTKIHKKHLTPINTIFITCLIMALIILFLDVEKIAKLASAFKVAMFIAVNLCVIILRETSVQWYKPSYKSPFYPYIQIFGIISGIILLFYLGIMPILVLFSIGIFGTILYLIFGKHSNRSGVLLNYGHIPNFFKKNKIKRHEFERTYKNNKLEKLNNKSSVIIALLGNEYSSENLVEIGMSLSDKKKIDVKNITELPDQTSLDAFEDKNSKNNLIKRKLENLSKLKNKELIFEPLITHNIPYSIENMSKNKSLEWMVIEWNGRSYNGILINNPLGWIISNIKSNFALFKDNGIKYFSEIVLAIRPNSKDLKELLNTTAKICSYFNARMTLLHIITKDTSEKEINILKNNSEKYLEKYSKFSDLKIVKSDSIIESIETISSEYDLLVIGTPKKDTLKSMLFGTGKDHFATNAFCSVLRLTINDS